MKDKHIPSEMLRQMVPVTHHLDWLIDDDTDDLAVRRELATASVTALGDFWDSDEDSEWQKFQA